MLFRSAAPSTGSADGSTFQCGRTAFSSSSAARRPLISLSSAETRIPSPAAAVSRFSSYSRASNDASSPMTGVSVRVGKLGSRPSWRANARSTAAVTWAVLNFLLNPIFISTKCLNASSRRSPSASDPCARPGLQSRNSCHARSSEIFSAISRLQPRKRSELLGRAVRAPGSITGRPTVCICLRVAP
jgi:hypothetical protein